MNAPWLLPVVISLAALAMGLTLGYLFRQMQLSRELKGRRAEAERIMEAANSKVRELELSARDEALKLRNEAEAAASRRRTELGNEEERLQKRRADLDDRLDKLEKRDQALSRRQSALDKRSNELEEKYTETL
ncbi:MAG: Rnase Y domain-containing protein, partial [Chloroflexota bacterium]